MKIAVDAMGGDFAPHNEILGALEAVHKDSTIEIVLIGKQDVIEQELSHHTKHNRIKVVHAEDVVTMHDSPMQALKEKKNSSLNIAMDMLNKGDVDAFVSAGNTGAVLTASIFKVGRIKNVERPAIVAVFPTLKKPLVILDIGANVDCRPKHLVQFAKMGSVFSEKILQVNNPTVRLLNIGEEKEKGNELTIESYQQLETAKDINFAGNLEPKDLLKGEADVLVCDGFVGNVILKFGECASNTIFTLIKEGVKSNLMATIGGIFMLPVFKNLKKKLVYDEYGGTLLLGVKKTVIIAHGSASPKAIRHAIFEAQKVTREKVIEQITEVMGH